MMITKITQLFKEKSHVLLYKPSVCIAKRPPLPNKVFSQEESCLGDTCYLFYGVQTKNKHRTQTSNISKMLLTRTIEKIRDFLFVLIEYDIHTNEDFLVQ